MTQNLSRRATLAGLGASLAAGPALARPPFRLRDKGQPLLSPSIMGEDGSTGKLADFAGKIILLNIWATWCPPCREEMPALDRFHGRLAGPDFMVLPLCIDDTGIQRGRRFSMRSVSVTCHCSGRSRCGFDWPLPSSGFRRRC